MKFTDIDNFRQEKSIILDTCFIIYELENQNEQRLIKFCDENIVLLTSFNIEELDKVAKKLGHEKRRLRDFLKRARLNFISIPVSLGNISGERKYVMDFDEQLLNKIHDPSDAILVVAAIKSRSDILTRDKHHLFTSILENKLNEYDIKVFNDLSKITD